MKKDRICVIRDFLLFRNNTRCAPSFFTKYIGYTDAATVRHRLTVTETIVCRRHTYITRVKITRVIFNPGRNNDSADAAIKMNDNH